MMDFTHFAFKIPDKIPPESPTNLLAFYHLPLHILPPEMDASFCFSLVSLVLHLESICY